MPLNGVRTGDGVHLVQLPSGLMTPARHPGTISGKSAVRQERVVYLRDYEALKFELTAILRGLRRYHGRLGGHEPEALRALFAQLAEDRFLLAVAGRFSRGKTSLMNAILGSDRLPVGVVPLTSVITMVDYGSDEKAVLHFHGTSLFMDIPLKELPSYITEIGNPGNHRGIEVAEVQLPAEFLRRGATFVDTPGLGSSILANTRTTESFLPRVDALILVSSHDSPLSEEEVAVLRASRATGHPAFVVLNKQDSVSEGGRRDAMGHAEAVLRALGEGEPVPLFSVSARDALAAKLAGDTAALAASGLPALESALVAFLVDRRRSVFLASICSRVAGLIDDTLPTDLRRELGEALDQLRARIDAAAPAPPVVPEPDSAALAALLPGCEVCQAIADAVFDTLTRYQGRLYADRGTQDDLARRGGLCRIHARQFEAVAAMREAAIAAGPLLHAQADALRRIAASGAPPVLQGEMVTDLLPSGTTCPICAEATRAEEARVRELAALVAAQGPDIVHTRSAPCVPHTARLVAAIADPLRASRVLVRQAALMERLADDTQRLALKFDALRRGTASREDVASAERAARVLLDHPSARYEPASPTLPAAARRPAAESRSKYAEKGKTP